MVDTGRENEAVAQVAEREDGQFFADQEFFGEQFVGFQDGFTEAPKLFMGIGLEHSFARGEAAFLEHELSAARLIDETEEFLLIPETLRLCAGYPLAFGEGSRIGFVGFEHRRGRFGPKARMPAESSLSTSPAARAPSGPTTTKPIPSS